jgi:hypothetical protein
MVVNGGIPILKIISSGSDKYILFVILITSPYVAKFLPVHIFFFIISKFSDIVLLVC